MQNEKRKSRERFALAKKNFCGVCEIWWMHSNEHTIEYSKQQIRAPISLLLTPLDSKIGGSRLLLLTPLRLKIGGSLLTPLSDFGGVN